MSSWRQLGEQHRAKQNAAIPQEWIPPQSKTSQFIGVVGDHGEFQGFRSHHLCAAASTTRTHLSPLPASRADWPSSSTRSRRPASPRRRSHWGSRWSTPVAKRVHPFSQAGFPVDPALDPEHWMHELNGARHAFAKAWQKIWRENDLDVVLAPGASTTAVPHDACGVSVYTMIWNLLNYPAGIIPYGKSSQHLDATPQKATAPFEADYGPHAWDGAPCAVQVIAPSCRDEECLQAMRIIDETLRRV
ncbi:hypothetical protein LQW54_009434 [Pestalotiopsis sp. IQ-011]